MPARLEPRATRSRTASLEGTACARRSCVPASPLPLPSMQQLHKALSSTAKLLSSDGCRRSRGTIPATSQATGLISMTAKSACRPLEAVRDRLRCRSTSAWGFRHRCTSSTLGMHILGRRPIASSINGSRGRVENRRAPGVAVAESSDRADSPHPSSREGNIPPLFGARLPPIGSESAGLSCCSYGLSGPRNSVPVTQMRRITPAVDQGHDRVLHSAAPGDLAEPGREPRPFPSNATSPALLRRAITRIISSRTRYPCQLHIDGSAIVTHHGGAATGVVMSAPATSSSRTMVQQAAFRDDDRSVAAPPYTSIGPPPYPRPANRGSSSTTPGAGHRTSPFRPLPTLRPRLRKSLADRVSDGEGLRLQ